MKSSLPVSRDFHASGARLTGSLPVPVSPSETPVAEHDGFSNGQLREGERRNALIPLLVSGQARIRALNNGFPF